MAAKKGTLAKKASENLSCPVCYQIFKNPKYLPCHHSYCEECLEKLQVQNKITCPECRTEATVPPGGVKDLDNNFFINRLVDELVLMDKVEGEAEVVCDECSKDDPVEAFCSDCTMFLCHICNEHHKRSNKTTGHSVIPIAELKEDPPDMQSKPKIPVCKQHDIELSFYCETCEQLVCMYCTVKDHNGHNHDTVKMMADRPRKALKTATAPLNEIIKDLSEAHDCVDKIRDSIREQGEEVNEKIDHHFDKVIQKALQQKEQLKQQVSNLVLQKDKEVTTQLEEIDCAQAKVLSVKQLSDAIEKSSDQEVLSAKKQVIDRVNLVTSKYKSLSLHPVQLATMAFAPAKDQFPQFGLVCSTAKPNPKNCELIGLPGYTFRDTKTEFTIITKDDDGHRCLRGGSQIFVYLAGYDESTLARDNHDGTYMAFFTSPHQLGEVNLSVFVDGQQIKGCPYTVTIRRNYISLGKPNKIQNNVGNMDEPWGVAVSKDGMWAVSDWSNHCVYIFNDKDQLVKKFGTQGLADGHLNRPKGIAFDQENCLYVTDSHRVQKFTIDGTYVCQFGNEESNDGKLKDPVGVTEHKGEVFVADSSSKCISVFTSDGEFLRTFGSEQLGCPYDVTVNANDELLVADCNHHCVYVFTLDGYYICKLGTKESSKGQLCHPYSLATGINGTILVADTFHDRVLVFDKDGNCIHSFGSRGLGNGQFSCPYGIAVSHNGSIFVTDHENKRVQIFSTY